MNTGFPLLFDGQIRGIIKEFAGIHCCDEDLFLQSIPVPCCLPLILRNRNYAIPRVLQ
jgi:hypothetical protein